jgi:hypothetical protein
VLGQNRIDRDLPDRFLMGELAREICRDVVGAAADRMSDAADVGFVIIDARRRRRAECDRIEMNRRSRECVFRPKATTCDASLPIFLFLVEILQKIAYFGNAAPAAPRGQLWE